MISDVDGLASNTIYSIVQHSTGYLWLGTANGLVRYDGQHFQTLKSEKLKDHEILSIVEDQYGNVWGINLRGQLFSVGKEFEEVEVKSGNGLPYFSDFIIYENNQLVGIEKNTESNNESVKLYFVDLEQDANTEKYIKHSLPINSLQKGKIEKLRDKLLISEFEFELDEDNNISGVLDSRFDFQNFFLISETDSVFLKEGLLNWRSNGQLKLSDVPFFIETYKVNSVLVVEDYLLIGTKNGVQVYSNDDQFNKGQTFFPSLVINTMSRDREGNILLGTANSGLIVYKSHFLKQWTRRNSILGSDLIYKLYQDSSALFVFQSDGYLSIFSNNGEIQTLKANVTGTVKEVLRLPTDKLLIQADRLYFYDLKTSESSFRLKDFNFKKIIIKDNYIYVCNHAGVFKVGKTSSFTYKDLNSSNKIFDNRAYDLLFDKTGALWIASTKGLFTYTIDTLQKIPIDASVSALCLDSVGNLYVGTNNEGVFVIKDNLVTDTLNIASGLLSNTVKKIFQAAGDTWILTNNSLSRKIGDNLLNYNANDGIPANEINDAAVFGGNIWIVTRLGATVFPLDFNPQNETPPLVYINNIKSRGGTLSSHDLNDISYNKNDISIHFNGINFTNRNKLKYKYQLQGYDIKAQSTEENYVAYPMLPAGQYNFSVSAVNEDGIASEAEEISFNITPPIYLRWWFYPLVSMVVIGVVLSIWYLQARRRERTMLMNSQLIKLQQQSLQTQMNPHFIFNSMNTIQEYITSNNKKSAIIYLSRFAKLIRRIFEYSKYENIDIDDEIQFLKLYIHLEQLRFKDKIIVEFKICDSVQNREEDISVPPLLLQPLIENAFKHGLFHKEGVGKLMINIEYQDNYLICTIEDDGVGRQRIKEMKKWQSEKYQSSGIETIVRRLELLKKDDDAIVDLFQIIDLESHEGTAKGTKVIIKIPTV